MSAPSPEDGRPGDVFVTTRWTRVVQAGRRSDPQSEQALAELCHAYWYPLYAYVRRRGHTREEAEDLTQGFFARFLEGNHLRHLRSEQGRFRAFLLASLKHFLANEWDKSQRLKRGGRALHLSLDWPGADQRYGLNAPDGDGPDRLYDREWALALLEKVMDGLREEYETEGKPALFQWARDFLTAPEEAVPYAEAAARLAMEEGALRVAVHRLRKRYRERLRGEIAQTLADPAAVGEELRSLQAALGGR